MNSSYSIILLQHDISHITSAIQLTIIIPHNLSYRSVIPSGNNNGVTVNVIEPPALRFSKARCSHGMFLAAVEKGGLKGGDHLLCIYANSADTQHSQVTHTHTPTSSSSSSSSALVTANHHTENANALTLHTIPPMSSNVLREILCIPSADTGLPAVVGRIHDIREGCSYIHNELASVLLSSYSLSATNGEKGISCSYDCVMHQ